MRFECPHCGEPNAIPCVKVGDDEARASSWIEAGDQTVRSGSTWYCSECRKPVVIEPQTPEERRDKFLARLEWLRNNTKMEVVDSLELRILDAMNAVTTAKNRGTDREYAAAWAEYDRLVAEQERALWVCNITNTRDGSGNGP